MSTRNLDKLFDPKSIAVIGASNKKGSVGYILLRNLIGAEYQGIVYPVNVSAQSVQGIQAYAGISQVPRKIDLAIIAVPAKNVPQTMRECGEAGVAGAVIVSSGFKEIGKEGKRLEDEVKSIAESYGVRIVGPNCLGYIRPAMNLNATFAHVIPPAGRVAFFSQSGALGTAILDWAAANNIGFSAFVSVGSMSDVDFGDLIDYFGADSHTSSIILYIESITDARKFMSAARHFAKSKPIIVVKSGRTARSALAAASHTGAIAGDDTLYSAVFRRAGVVRVDQIEDLFDASEALSRVSSPRGPAPRHRHQRRRPRRDGQRPPAAPRRRARGAHRGDRREAQGRAARLRRARQPRRRRRRRRRQALRHGGAGAHGRPQLRRRARHPHAAGDERPHRHRAGAHRRRAQPPAQAAAHVVHGRDQGRRGPAHPARRPRAHLRHARGRGRRLHVHVPVHAQPREPLRDAGRHPPRLRARPRRGQEDLPRRGPRRAQHPERARGQGGARGVPDHRRQDDGRRDGRGVRQGGRGDRLPRGHQDPQPRHHAQERRGRHRPQRAFRPGGRQPVRQDHRPRAGDQAGRHHHRRRRPGHEPRRLRGHPRLQEGPHLRTGDDVRHGRHRRRALPRRRRRLPAGQPGAGAVHDPEHQGQPAAPRLPRQGAGGHGRARAGAGEDELPAGRLPRDPRDGHQPAAGAHRRRVRARRAHRHRAQGRAQDRTCPAPTS